LKAENKSEHEAFIFFKKSNTSPHNSSAQTLPISPFLPSSFQRHPLISHQLTLCCTNSHKHQHDQQCHVCTCKLKSKHGLIASSCAQLRHHCLHHVREGQQDGNAKIQQTVDEGASEALLIERHAGADEDVGDVEGDVDAEGGAQHGGQDIGPVGGAVGGQREEEGGQEPAEPRDGDQEGARDEVQDAAADDGEEDAAEAHGHVPGGDLEGGGVHDGLHVEGCVEEEDAEHAVGEEEGDDEGGEVGDAEEVGGDERGGGDPAFDVDG